MLFVYCHQNVGPENFGHPNRNFQWKNFPPGPIFSVKMVRPWKFGPGHADSQHVRIKVFSLYTAPTFPHILVPIWSLSLTGWEVLSWDSTRLIPYPVSSRIASGVDCVWVGGHNLLFYFFNSFIFWLESEQCFFLVISMVLHLLVFKVRTFSWVHWPILSVSDCKSTRSCVHLMGL